MCSHRPPPAAGPRAWSLAPEAEPPSGKCQGVEDPDHDPAASSQLGDSSQASLKGGPSVY